jgi:hypothetical protein
MLISVRHITRYRYADPVSYTIQILRLTPLSFVATAISGNSRSRNSFNDVHPS